MIRIRAPIAMRMMLSCRSATAIAMSAAPSTIRNTGLLMTGTSLSSANIAFSLSGLLAVIGLAVIGLDVIGAGGQRCRCIGRGVPGHLPDGLADQVGQGAVADTPLGGRGPDCGHDRRREHARVQIALRV